MKKLKSLLTSVAFSLAGVAVHTNAATENHRNACGVCFQLTPVGTRRTQTSPPAEGTGNDAPPAS